MENHIVELKNYVFFYLNVIWVAFFWIFFSAHEKPTDSHKIKSLRNEWPSKKIYGQFEQLIQFSGLNFGLPGLCFREWTFFIKMNEYFDNFSHISLFCIDFLIEIVLMLRFFSFVLFFVDYFYFLVQRLWTNNTKNIFKLSQIIWF